MGLGRIHLDTENLAWLGAFHYRISELCHDLRRHGRAVASVILPAYPLWVIEDYHNSYTDSCTEETLKPPLRP